MPRPHLPRRILRLLFIAATLTGLSTTACAPLSSVACDRADSLCGNVDLEACDATLALVAPRIRDELLDCAMRSRTCGDVTSCFANYQLPLPLELVILE